MLRICSILVLALMTTLPVAAAEPEARVIDGDTIDLSGQRIRLFGIDAPEKGQVCDQQGQVRDCGAWSARVLRDLIGTDPVQCRARDTDRYGRTVATCTVAGRDLGEMMVGQGAARAYTRYSARYLAHERAAKTQGIGIWAGRMVTPEAYRHATPAQISSSGCLIKGNIGASGKHIYHMPGQRDYEATRISPSKGEAWFCTEAEARRAGFRKANR
jgi:endonuclease YncB( thermonuclease family)